MKFEDYGYLSQNIHKVLGNGNDVIRFILRRRKINSTFVIFDIIIIFIN